MTTPAAHILWTGTVEGIRYRIVDTSSEGPDRFVLEQQMQPDSLGGIGWQRIALPLAAVLQAALSQLLESGRQ